MLKANEKIELFKLMNKALEVVMGEIGEKDWESQVKQTFMEDDKWHGRLEITYYDSEDEWYENIEPLYRVTCSSLAWNCSERVPYGYIAVYKRVTNTETMLKEVTTDYAKVIYND